jgi:hypothetical protein
MDSKQILELIYKKETLLLSSGIYGAINNLPVPIIPKIYKNSPYGTVLDLSGGAFIGGLGGIVLSCLISKQTYPVGVVIFAGASLYAIYTKFTGEDQPSKPLINITYQSESSIIHQNNIDPVVESIINSLDKISTGTQTEFIKKNSIETQTENKLSQDNNKTIEI